MQDYNLFEIIKYLLDSHLIFNLSFENIFGKIYDIRFVCSDINCGLSAFEEANVISDLKYDLYSSFGKNYWNVSFRFNGDY